MKKRLFKIILIVVLVVLFILAFLIVGNNDVLTSLQLRDYPLLSPVARGVSKVVERIGAG